MRHLLAPKLVVYETPDPETEYRWEMRNLTGDTLACSVGRFTRSEIDNFVTWLGAELEIAVEWEDEE